MKWLALSYLTHLSGLLLFYVGWTGTFGVEPRVIPVALDIVWPVANLLGAGVLAGGFAGLAIAQSDNKLHVASACLSIFLSVAWVYAVSTILGWW